MGASRGLCTHVYFLACLIAGPTDKDMSVARSTVQHPGLLGEMADSRDSAGKT